MATPTYQSTTVTDFGSDATSHAANLPATVTAGDLLLAVAAFDSTPSTITTPSGWTRLIDVGGDPVAGVFAKVADGTEDGGTVNFVTSDAQRGSVHVLRITDWQGTLAGIGAANAFTGTTAIIGMCPSPTSRDYLFIVAQCKSVATVWGATPTSWTNAATTGVGENTAAGGAVATATRAVTGTATDANPLWISGSGIPAFIMAVWPSGSTP